MKSIQHQKTVMGIQNDKYNINNNYNNSINIKILAILMILITTISCK